MNREDRYVSEYELYCFAQSGNAYKAALMLNLCGADWRPRFVDFFNGETRKPAFRALNPMGEVPVLVHEGRAITQSGVILDYLAEKTGRFGWQGDEERREILRWLLFDNHKLNGQIGTYRFLTNFAKTADPAVVAFLKARIDSALGVLESHLAAHDYVALDRLTIADISLCGYLFWREEIAVDWDGLPAILRWLDRLRALEGWVHPYELMPGHPLP